MRLVCENHPTKAWPDECNCGPGMNDPVPAMARALCKAKGHEPDEIVTHEILYSADGLVRLPTHGFERAAWEYYRAYAVIALDAYIEAVGSSPA